MMVVSTVSVGGIGRLGEKVGEGVMVGEEVVPGTMERVG